MARDLKLQVVLDAVDRVTKPFKKITQGSGKTAEALKASREQLKTLERAQQDLRGFRKLKEQSKESATALDAQQRQVRELTQQIENAEGPTKQLTRQREAAIRQARKLKDRYQGEQRQLEDLRRGMTRVDGVTGSYSDQQRELTRRVRDANQQIESQKNRLGEVARKQRAAADAAKRYHRSIGRANNMTGAGFTAAATGGAALYGGARMLAPGVEYGETMSRVQALTRTDENDERFKALKAQARELGSSTAFSASQVGQGQSFLAMAGFTPEAIRTSMSDMLNLALAGGLDLGRTADISSNILSGFGLAPDQMGRVGDVLTATTTRANVDLEMLGDSMKYVAPQAKAMGLSLEQAAAMAGMLGNVGIQGSQAGTTLRAMMTRLAAPTAAASGALKTLGVNAKDAQGDLRDVPSILADVAKATEDMGNAERAGYLKDIFGEEPGAGMAELIAKQGTAGIEQFTEIITQSAGESARVAKTMADNIGGDLKGLRSAWDEVGISITDTNEGPLRDLIQTVTAVTRWVGNWIKENPELAGTLAKVGAALAVVVAAGGALTVMLTSILGPIAAVRYAMTLLSLNPAALTIMGIVAAVAALAAAAYLIYKNWGAISGWFGDRWDDVKAAFSGGIGSVMRLLANWSPIGLLYRGITAALEKLGVDIPDKFKSLGGFIVDGLIGGLTGKLGQLKDKVVGMAGSVKNWFADVLGINSPSRVFAEFGGWTVEGLISGLTSKLAALKNKVTGIASSVKGWFAGVLDINSPSRVFAQYGGYTIDGLNQGLDAQRNEPARRIAQIAKSVTRAGAGMALGAATLPAAAATPIANDVPIDTRAPLQSPSGGSGINIHGGINIEVNASPGMDEQALARYVRAEVERALADASRDAEARRRSAFHDTD
ncbi:phage tail tape measure protein [Chromohalobacter canadensis]|uniref:phage tail tape measure protein n=1 Tax=Chromohalobacter canadensis TaxID=141389 RepID=UPI0021C0F07F|nr:phage tail tape measure protein [Chromohalobacter canadensis]MCT8467005.1 phage tail tape measure protein [Chromohalobacter canadensis]